MSDKKTPHKAKPEKAFEYAYQKNDISLFANSL